MEECICFIVFQIGLDRDRYENIHPFFYYFFLSDGGYVHATTEWGALNEEVDSLYQQGDYASAIAVAKKALQIAKRDLGPDYSNVAVSLNNLAEVYRVQ